MTLDELWTSPENAPSSIEQEAFARDTMARVARERRQRKGMLVFSAVIMALVTGQALYHRITHPEDFSAAGSLYLMLASQWLLIVYWFRQLRPGGAALMGADTNIRDSLSRLLAEVEAERRTQLGVVALFAVFAPLIAIAIRQLVADGKMAPDEALSAGIAFLLISAISCGWILWRLVRQVLPRRKRLLALTGQYGEAGPADFDPASERTQR